MTTSVLSTHAHELTGHDIQCLRDFALEAPWEWKQLLTACADLVDASGNMDADGIRDMVAENERLDEEVTNLKAAAEKKEEEEGGKWSTLEALQDAGETFIEQVEQAISGLAAVTTKEWQKEMKDAIKKFQEAVR